jgi:hypothetical protein
MTIRISRCGSAAGAQPTRSSPRAPSLWFSSGSRSCGKSKPLTVHAFGMTKLLIRIDLLSELAIARVANSRTPNLVSATLTSGRGLMAKTPARLHRLVRPFHLVEIGGVHRIDVTVARLDPIAVAEPPAGAATLVRALERRIRGEQWRLSLTQTGPEWACGFVYREARARSRCFALGDTYAG